MDCILLAACYPQRFLNIHKGKPGIQDKVHMNFRRGIISTKLSTSLESRCFPWLHGLGWTDWERPYRVYGMTPHGVVAPWSNCLCPRSQKREGGRDEIDPRLELSLLFLLTRNHLFVLHAAYNTCDLYLVL